MLRHVFPGVLIVFHGVLGLRGRNWRRALRGTLGVWDAGGRWGEARKRGGGGLAVGKQGVSRLLVI